MAHSKGSKGNSGKGFGSMDEQRKREVASQGGKASAQSNTSNRGFASMDKNRQREISSQGGKASQAAASGKGQRGSTGRNEQNPSALSENRDVSSGSDLSERDLNSLEEEDEVAGGRGEPASYSETDEDEDEGVGDGTLGRSSKSLGGDNEG
jgi:uncharacterized protein